MALHTNLKHHRTKLNWTQQKLSEVSGVSQSEISAIESGNKSNPGVIIVKLLAKALDISISDLVK